jgi:hypothetical protein
VLSPPPFRGRAREGAARYPIPSSPLLNPPPKAGEEIRRFALDEERLKATKIG